MSIQLRLILIAGAFVFLWITVGNIRRHGLDLRHSICWFAGAVLLVLMALFPDAIGRLSHLAGIETPSNFVFLALIAFLMLSSLSLSASISRQHTRIRFLVQEQALQDYQMRTGNLAPTQAIAEEKKGEDRLLVIVPAYNEAEALGDTVKRIREAAPLADILVVNDGSEDATAAVAAGCGAACLNHVVNLGIGAAVQSGYRFADRYGYDFAAQIDGDGQHDPAFLLPMLAWMKEEQVDLGIGSRFLTGEGFQSSFMRRKGIRFLSALIRLTCGASVRDVTSGFRMADRRVIGLFAQSYSDDYPEADSIPAVVRCGGKVAEFPVVMEERKAGRSSISTGKSIYYMIKVSFSILLYPLMHPAGRFASEGYSSADEGTNDESV